MNYYNENDVFAATWLRNLIAAKLIPAGDVDERDIRKVQGADLKGYTQCHFFAGIGGWSLALALAGWNESEPVWTGSCPCQPFSVAGKRKGKQDERHLWPEFLRLISDRLPSIVFGEQVASKDGLEWLSGVRADLEGSKYEVGASDLCAAGVSAPHIRQRLYWGARHLADATDSNGRRGERRSQEGTWPEGQRGERLGGGGSPDGLEDSARIGRRGGRDGDSTGNGRPLQTQGPGDARGVADADGGFAGDGGIQRGGQHGQRPAHGRVGFWDAYDVLQCTDKKARRVEPGTFPLASGVPARVGKLRAYGNAIVPQVGAEFVLAFVEAMSLYTRKV